MTDQPTPHEERRSSDSLRLRSISPILTVDDIDASLSWYRDVVGFHVKETWETDGRITGAAMVAGSQTIMIAQDDWAKGRDRNKGEGLRLFLETNQDIDQMAAAIKERGGTLDQEPEDTPWGPRAFAISDPNGFKFTVLSEMNG